METTLYAFLLVGSYYRFEVEVEDRGRLPISAVLFGLCWMTRPETPAYGLYFLLRRLSLRDKPSMFDVRWMIASGSIILPYEAFGFLYYGHLLPNTAVAKDQGWAFWDQVLVTDYLTTQGWGLPVLLVVGVAGCLMRPARLPLVVWTPILSSLIFASYALWDWMPRHRFFVPTIPFHGILIVLGATRLWERFSSGRLLTLMLSLALVAPALDYGYTQMAKEGFARGGPRFPYEKRRWDWWKEVPRNVTQRLWPIEESTWIVAACADRDDYVGIRDIGFPSFVTMNPIWDIAGIVTETMARYRSGRGTPELEDAVVDDILDRDVKWFHIPSSSFGRIFNRQKRLAERYDSSPEKSGTFCASLMGRGNVRYRVSNSHRSGTSCDELRRVERNLSELDRRFPEYAPYAWKRMNSFLLKTRNRCGQQRE
jgi:hypothetical protein